MEWGGQVTVRGGMVRDEVGRCRRGGGTVRWGGVRWDQVGSGGAVEHGVEWGSAGSTWPVEVARIEVCREARDGERRELMHQVADLTVRHPLQRHPPHSLLMTLSTMAVEYMRS